MNQDQLDGWKDIAAYVGRSVRTVQRWERELGLPIRRIPSRGGDVIYALRSEIDAWKLTSAAQAGDAAAESLAGEAQQRRTVVMFALAGAALIATVVIVVTKSGTNIAANAPPVPIAGATDRPRSGLGQTAWPVRSHDNRHTNATDVHGPSAPVRARVLFDAKVPLGLGIEPGQTDDLVVGRNGAIYFSTCGISHAIRPDGSEIFQHPLVTDSVQSTNMGVVVTSTDMLLEATHDCPDRLGTQRTSFQAVTERGELLWSHTQGGMLHSPALADEGTAYVIDEFNTVRAYATGGELKWTTDLPGFSSGAPAINRRGEVVIGTDGGRFNQTSLWTLDAATGKPRWSKLTGTIRTPLIGSGDTIYVPEDGVGVHALRDDGTLTWTTPLPDVQAPYALSLAPNGTVLVRTMRELIALDANGHPRWSFAAAHNGRIGGPAVIDAAGSAYLATDSAVQAIDTSGHLQWSLPIADPGTLIIAEDGALLVVSAGSKIVRIETAAAASTR